MSGPLREEKPLTAAEVSATSAVWRNGSRIAGKNRKGQGSNPVFHLSLANSVHLIQLKFGLLAGGNRHSLRLRDTAPYFFQQFGKHIHVAADLRHILPHQG